VTGQVSSPLERSINGRLGGRLRRRILPQGVPVREVVCSAFRAFGCLVAGQPPRSTLCAAPFATEGHHALRQRLPRKLERLVVPFVGSTAQRLQRSRRCRVPMPQPEDARKRSADRTSHTLRGKSVVLLQALRTSAGTPFCRANQSTALRGPPARHWRFPAAHPRCAMQGMSRATMQEPERAARADPPSPGPPRGTVQRARRRRPPRR
jgi:hypothetical protein